MENDYNEYYRTVADLLDIYEEEPEIRDIFVEGEEDKTFFEFFLESNNIYDVIVYDISSIKVSKDYSEKLGLSINKNKKNQVLVLAFELTEKLKPPNQARCVVDKDFDSYLLKSLFNWEVLYYTDYANREMYFLNPKTFKKFIKIGLHGLPINEFELINRLVLILQEIYLIKLASITLGLNLRKLNFSNKKRCPSSHYNINFEESKYIQDYLGVSPKSKIYTKFSNEIHKLRKGLSKDFRNNIHGHDLSDLLTHYLNCNYKKKINGKKRKFSSVNIESTLYCCIELKDLKNEPLFKKILQWLEK